MSARHAMDADLHSIQEARDLVARAAAAQRQFASASQSQVDHVGQAMATAASRAAEALVRLAVDETRMGVYKHKILKNRFASDLLLEYILPMRTVGVPAGRSGPAGARTRRADGCRGGHHPHDQPDVQCDLQGADSDQGPHCHRDVAPSARRAFQEEAAQSAGALPGLVTVMTAPSLAGTNALMRHRETAVLLATGGAEMVRAVYTAGKPAYGVGPGNVPAIIERSADLDKAVRDVVDGKTFDAGVLCSSENSVIVDRSVAAAVRTRFVSERAHFCTPSEKQQLARYMIPASGKGINPDVVGQHPVEIARRVGFEVRPTTKLLVVELTQVGPVDPLSREKLCPVLGYYVEDGWARCCERAIELLRYGGVGHSLGIHSRDPEVIERFFLEKPAFRIVVNSNTASGAVGYTPGFAPAMTLGPGSWGGSITSDNTTPVHVLNIKRLGEEIRPYYDPLRGAPPSTRQVDRPVPREGRRERRSDSDLASPEIDVGRIVDDFIATFRTGRP